MNRLGTLAYYMLLSVVAVGAGFAQGLTVDWKFYGGASIKGNHQVCFYEAKGVAQAADGHILVWTKCLPQTALDNIDTKTALGNRIVQNTAKTC
jgi:hypothetical protein